MGHQHADDGLVSNMWNEYFHSDRETGPWLQPPLKERINVTGVSLINPVDCCDERLILVEVRAGMAGIGQTHHEYINGNGICGRSDGPSNYESKHIIDCAEPILPDFITVQLMYDNAYLQSNEL